MRDDGVIHGAIEVGVAETLDDAKQNIAAIAQLAEGRRCPVIVDISKAKSVGREARRYYSGPECAETTTAVALVTGSLVGRAVGNFFLGLNKPSFPLRLFNSEEEALAWLMSLPR
jgi:hypothetical protein